MGSDANACGGIVNTYLANIVARTLNTKPPVRPRLLGRFDPLPIARQESIDPSALDRTPPLAFSRQTETERVHESRENAGQNSAGQSQPVSSLSRSPERDPAALRAPEETSRVETTII